MLGVLTIFSGLSASAASVTLAWDPSPDPSVVGYFVYYGDASRSYTTKIDVGNVTSVTVTGLVEGVAYYFAATAYNVLGIESDFSEEVVYTVPGVPGNQFPTLNPIANVTLQEDTPSHTVALSGISSGSAAEAQVLTVTATSSNPGLIPHPTVNYSSPSTTGSLVLHLVANASGTALISVQVNDNEASNNIIVRTFTVTVNPVNDPPTLNSLANVTVDEDAGAQTVQLSGISSGAPDENQTLTVTATSSNPSLIPHPVVNYTSPNATGTLTFTPVANGFGSATITVTVNDGQSANATTTRSFTVTVNPVNDPPTLNPIANLGITENAGLQTVPLSGISSGAANENQSLSISAVSSNPGLIPHPTVVYTSPNSTGSLRFTPVAGQSGEATITVTVNDGQAVNNTVVRTFIVSVGPVNDRPTLNSIANVTVEEDSGPTTVNLSGISSGATNEHQTLTVTATSSNPALIPHPTVNYTSPNSTGTLTFTPVPNGHGSATISVTVDDGDVANNTITRTFTVTVTPVNDPPTLNPLADVTVDEDSGPHTVNLTGISSGATNESQTLLVMATSSNPALIPHPTVSYSSPNATGTLTFTPAANAFGTATITVTVDDRQSANNRTTRTFTVTVNPVNDPPTLNPIANLTLNENTGEQTVSLSGISAGPGNENQPLSISAVSSHPGLIPHPTVVYTSPNSTGTLRFTPVPGASGTATITVTVNDGQGSNNTFSRTFTVAVADVNDPPTLDVLSSITVAEDSGPRTVELKGITSGATNEHQVLTVTAVSSNPALIPHPTVNYTSPNTTGTLTFTPVENGSGTATISVTVNDGEAINNTITRSFVVTVTPVNDPPTLNSIGNISLVENAGQQTVNLSGISSGAPNENQSLSVTAVSSNPGLIPHPTVSYSSPSSTGILRFTPVPGASGTATITVTVNDGQSTNNTFSRSFVVSVNALPTISPIANQTISVNSNTLPIAFLIGDRETPASQLTLSASSSEPTLLPAANIFFGGSGSNRTVTLVPVFNQTGTAEVTITVSDDTSFASRTFLVTVLGVPTAPNGLTIVTNGQGEIVASASINSGSGKVYTLTALPGENQEFLGWSGGLQSKSQTITFIMNSNLVLQANFIPSPYKPVAGSYNGLFYENDRVRISTSGSFSFIVTPGGTYSGKLIMGKTKYSFTGKLDLQCRATNVISRKDGPPLTLRLRVGEGGMYGQMSGELTDGTWTAGLHGERAAFNASNPASQAGNYTLILPGSAAPGEPFGHGYGTVKVDSSGRVRFAGVLADGTKVTQSAILCSNGQWPLYASLYSGYGVLVSWITFEDREGDDLNGTVAWVKAPGARSKLYTGGFNLLSPAVGSLFYVPKGAPALSMSEGRVIFAGGDLSSSFENAIAFNAKGKVVNLSDNKLSLAISTKTGTFKGKVVNPTTGGTHSFAGAVLQKQNAAFGYLTGSSQTSRVEVQP
ncbi:MAG TPA: tandem-95 repeat protein [Verrucomicrobia bacterium]|nr:tandem-95 repeat protein [Verrucomicrobiota bacterium]